MAHGVEGKLDLTRRHRLAHIGTHLVTRNGRLVEQPQNSRLHAPGGLLPTHPAHQLGQLPGQCAVAMPQQLSPQLPDLEDRGQVAVVHAALQLLLQHRPQPGEHHVLARLGNLRHPKAVHRQRVHTHLAVQRIRRALQESRHDAFEGGALHRDVSRPEHDQREHRFSSSATLCTRGARLRRTCRQRPRSGSRRPPHPSPNTVVVTGSTPSATSATGPLTALLSKLAARRSRPRSGSPPVPGADAPRRLRGFTGFISPHHTRSTAAIQRSNGKNARRTEEFVFGVAVRLSIAGQERPVRVS